MNCEQRYNEALERARKEYEKHESLFNGFREMLSYVFPELEESEDERIRKSIIGFLITISSLKDGKTVSNKDFDTKAILEWIAWLEKQVPVHLSHDDEIMIRQLTEYFTTGKGLQNTNDTVVEWLEDIKRKLEKQGEQTSSQTNERAWLYLVCDVLTWKDGIGQYLDDPRVQELAKKLCSEYAQKLW